MRRRQGYGEESKGTAFIHPPKSGHGRFQFASPQTPACRSRASLRLCVVPDNCLPGTCISQKGETVLVARYPYCLHVAGDDDGDGDVRSVIHK